MQTMTNSNNNNDMQSMMISAMMKTIDDQKEEIRRLEDLYDVQQEEIKSREEERYCMWETYCLYEQPDIWDDEKDYSKNINSSYISSCQHPMSEEAIDALQSSED